VETPDKPDQPAKNQHPADRWQPAESLFFPGRQVPHVILTEGS
jgi:hypothetical protein